jgi:predicted TIM-barrel fold metal-dependent hydrolase
VRFNPYLWPDGESMANAVGREMYRRAGQLGAPVGHMPFKGLLKHIDDIQILAADYPNTTVIVDHFGFCSASNPESDEWQALLSLARFPQVYVKISAHFRVSQQDFPYSDTKACVRNLLQAFGPQRLMWGSDFPWVTKKCAPCERPVPATACTSCASSSVSLV